MLEVPFQVRLASAPASPVTVKAPLPIRSMSNPERLISPSQSVSMAIEAVVSALYSSCSALPASRKVISAWPSREPNDVMQSRLPSVMLQLPADGSPPKANNDELAVASVRAMASVFCAMASPVDWATSARIWAVMPLPGPVGGSSPQATARMAAAARKVYWRMRNTFGFEEPGPTGPVRPRRVSGPSGDLQLQPAVDIPRSGGTPVDGVAV